MIGFDCVSHSFDDKLVLDHCSFTLPSSGLIGLSAPSGVGKTTLIRLLGGMIAPQSGTVLRPPNVAILFQENRLLPWRTVNQHLSDVLPHSRRGEIAAWLELADLSQESERYPHALSGGMGRRLALCRTLALGGDLFLLDEPFTGVDAPRVAKLMKFLSQQTAPVVIASHEPLILAQCPVVLQLKDHIITQISAENSE